MGYLSNVQFLIKLSSFIHWSAIIFIFLGGGLQIVRLFFDQRINTIRDRESFSLQRTINQQNQKLKKIEHEESSRTIDRDKVLFLASDLKKLRGEKILITSVLEDEESFSLADQLKKVFEKAGWQVNGVYISMSSNQKKGLMLVMNSRSHEDKARYLMSIFRSIGLQFNSTINKGQNEDLGIIVSAE